MVKKKSSVSCTKVYVFSDSVLVFGMMNENPQSNIVWEDKLTCFKIHQEDAHSSDMDQKRSGISTHESKPRREWDRVSELMMMKFSESGHPVFRSTSPLLQGVLRGSTSGGKLSIHFCADEGTIETVFRTIISVNQLSIYGAVADMCEE